LNFLCISYFNENIEWLKEYNNPHVIYNKVWESETKFDKLNNDNKLSIKLTLQERYPNFNIVNGELNGYNINEYLRFIIDNYENLPKTVAFIKANTIGRHVSKNCFNKLIKNEYFTCIEEWESHSIKQSSFKSNYAMFSCDGGWMEKNTSWYLNHPKHPIKYFNNYNQFLKFCFKNPVIPKYIRFAPGANYIVPKEQILKYDKTFYKNLKLFTSHSKIPGEAHMLERALYTIWNCNFEVSETMKNPIEYSIKDHPEFGFIKKSNIEKFKSVIRKLK
tara:strand:+ start:507 stop:1334 length:828 start_codon:yes stop_codon:yes gene_type:complete